MNILNLFYIVCLINFNFLSSQDLTVPCLVKFGEIKTEKAYVVDELRLRVFKFHPSMTPKDLKTAVSRACSQNPADLNMIIGYQNTAHQTKCVKLRKPFLKNDCTTLRPALAQVIKNYYTVALFDNPFAPHGRLEERFMFIKIVFLTTATHNRHTHRPS